MVKCFLTFSCEEPQISVDFPAPQDLEMAVGLFHTSHLVPSRKQSPLLSMLEGRRARGLMEASEHLKASASKGQSLALHSNSAGWSQSLSRAQRSRVGTSCFSKERRGWVLSAE